MKHYELPSNAGEVTIEWLNHALRSDSSGLVLDSNITSFSFDVLGEGKGFMNQVVRLTLQIGQGTSSSDLTVVAKFPSQDPEIQALNDRAGEGQRENMFYQDIGGNTDMPTPTLYFSGFDAATGNSILIIEDLAQARPGDSVVGCSLDDVDLAIRCLADFQAKWWNDSGVAQYAWLPQKNEDASFYAREYDRSWNILMNKSQGMMPDRLWVFGQNLGRYIGTVRRYLSGSPTTLVHGDYRPDNCFFGNHQDQRPLTIFDWEYCTEGRGVYDVATFLCEALTTKERAEYEIDFLVLYHSLLVDKGITGYSFDQCLIDYRWAYLDLTVFWAVTGGPCDWTSSRAKQYLDNTLERIDAALYDNECAKLIL